MAKTVTNDMSRFAKRVTSTFGRMQTKRTFTYLGKAAIKMIQERTRKGYGVDKQNGPASRLEKLSDSYKKWRKGKGRKYLGMHAKPTLSNLNLTGSMLDSMRILVIRKDRITIGPSKKKHPRSKLTNWKIANIHHKGDGVPKRRFNFLSRRQSKEIVDLFEEALNKELKNSRLARR